MELVLHHSDRWERQTSSSLKLAREKGLQQFAAGPYSIAFRNQRPGEFLQNKEAACLRRHIGRRDPRRRLVAERHPRSSPATSCRDRTRRRSHR